MKLVLTRKEGKAMSAKVTIKVPMIKGVVTLHSSPQNPRLYLACANNYIPFELSSDTLGNAVDTLLQNLHQLKRTPEAVARSKMAAENARKTRENNKIAEATANAAKHIPSKKQEGNKVA